MDKNFVELRKQTLQISGERAFLTEEGASASALRQELAGKIEK